jgi:hypothetical protein
MAPMCRVLQVGRSGFYAWQRRGMSARTQANQTLIDRMRVNKKWGQATFLTGSVDALVFGAWTRGRAWWSGSPVTSPTENSSPASPLRRTKDLDPPGPKT